MCRPRSALAVLVATALTSAVAAQRAQPSRPELVAPHGMPSPVPGSAGFDPEVAALGRDLFFDTELSVDRRTACSTCHRPEHGFASVEALPPGSLGKRALRNAPTLFNRAYGTVFSWDGKAATLEEQVILPIANPNEMALPLHQAVSRLRASARYSARFEALFKRPAAQADLAVALASYVRTLTHGGTVIDAFQAGEGSRHLTKAERAGLWIYESKGRCWRCHGGPNFSDEGFHNTGVGVVDGKPRPGRMGITGKQEDAGRFKTPTLRGLAFTGPYMHDGSLATLRDVVEFYRRGGNANPGLDAALRPLSLSDEEAENLVAFLRALSRPASRGDAVDDTGRSRKGRPGR